MRFKAVVAVRPADRARRPTRASRSTDVPEKAGDDDLDRALEPCAKTRATLVPVDRPVQLGDTATIDYAGKIDGVAFEGGTATGQQVGGRARNVSSPASPRASSA